MAELDQFFNPSAVIIKQRQGLIEPQIASATKGLETRKENEFRDITSRANARGVVYSGLPIEEEARYTGEQFLPALASLRQTGQEQNLSLAESLAGLRREQGLLGQQIRQGELDRDEARRQADRAARAASAGAASSTSGLQSILDQILNQSNPKPTSLPGIKLKNPKLGGKAGFALAIGKTPVSAFEYSRRQNVDFGDLLYSMASEGDSYAERAYREIANNGGNITTSLRAKYPALFWQPQGLLSVVGAR